MATSPHHTSTSTGTGYCCHVTHLTPHHTTSHHLDESHHLPPKPWRIATSPTPLLSPCGTIWEDYNDDIGPKQHDTRLLGPWGVFFNFLFVVFFNTYKIILRFSNVPSCLGPGIITTPLHHYTTTPLHGHVTTPSYHHQAAAGDEGSRPACLEPLEVCFFFLLSLTILIYLHLQL